MADQQHQTVTISKQQPAHPALNFKALRDEGISHLQRLAGKTWTDHNVHDPGITILDQVCYALTDLSYRISFDTKDLLARAGNQSYNSLYSPATILSTNPVTLNDFRKVLLDIPGVKNAWLEKVERPSPEIYFDPKQKTLSLTERETLAADKPSPARELINIRGLYRVFVTKTEGTLTLDLYERVRQRLQNCRNLCEDFEELTILTDEKVIVTGTVEVGEVEDANRLAANVLYRLANWMSPSIKFYTLQQMQARGLRIDEIMDGPSLQHGFIDDAELDNFNRHNKLYASDFIREIMAEQGVRVVTDVWMSTAVKQANNWVLQLDGNRVPVLDAAASLEKGLVFKKNGQPLNINASVVLAYFAQYQHAQAAPLLAPYQLDIVPAKLEPREIGTYFSIQHHFPLVYGIGSAGLPDTVPPVRRAQARQLKGYLLFFEQLLANYFAQVGSLKELFSFHSDNARTYFSQSLLDLVPDADALLKEAYNDDLDTITEAPEDALTRKNRFLDHLLGRFSESLADYSLWLNDQQILTAKAGGQDVLESEKHRNINYKTTLVNAKLNFLQNYPLLGTRRGTAFNRTVNGWQNQNVSGLEKRIAAKLGIADYQRTQLGAQQPGFHMVEHILLRPSNVDRAAINDYTANKYFAGFTKAKNGFMICECENHGLQNGDVILINDKNVQTPYEVTEVFEHNFKIKADFDVNINKDRKDNSESPLSWIRRDFNSTIFVFDAETEVKDPYSFQLTFVFPADNLRFADKNFREFIETTIREETPAHLTVFIQWMKNDELKRFEDAYKLFLNRLAVN